MYLSACPAGRQRPESGRVAIENSLGHSRGPCPAQKTARGDEINLGAGSSDKIVFNTILRSIQGRPYLGVAVASVEGIWEPGNKQARALAKAVVALASHARRIALFDDDGDPKAIEGLRRFLSEIDVTLNILARGDIEDYWLMDAAFLSRLIEESIAEATNEHNREIPPVGEAALSLRAEARSLGGAKKGADVLRSIFEKSLIRFDKIPAATVATRLMVEPVGAVVLKALSDDLRRTIEVPA